MHRLGTRGWSSMSASIIKWGGKSRFLFVLGFFSFFFSRVFNKRLISVTQLKAAADHVKFLLTLKNYSFWRRNNLLPVI